MSANRERYLLFSLDTEPDDVRWRGLSGGAWTHENLRGLPGIQERMDALGIRITYLLSHSVAVQGSLEGLLAERLAEGACEVGTHFHPGDTPPFRPGGDPGGDNILAVPEDLLEEKFATLHRVITARFGRPTSFRSGAWVLDARMAAILARYGYLVDSSVTPGISWKANRRASYLKAPMRAYRLGTGDPSVPGDTDLLEVPVSIWSPHRVPGLLAGDRLASALTMPLATRTGLAVRLFRALRPEPPQWLRPAFTTADDMVRAARHLHAGGAEYLHVMCHSNELWPGTSPFCRDHEALEAYHARLERILRAALDMGYRPATLSGYAALAATEATARLD